MIFQLHVLLMAFSRTNLALKSGHLMQSGFIMRIPSTFNQDSLDRWSIGLVFVCT